MIEIGIIQGIFGFVLYLGVASVILRLARRTEPALLVIISAALTSLVALAVLLSFGQTVNIWVFATSYCFFSLCFLMAFGAIYKSISLRILLDLSKRPDRTDLYDNVLARYISEESYQNRLMVIQNKRLAIRIGKCFTLTQWGRKIAQSAQLIQKLFGITHSG